MNSDYRSDWLAERPTTMDEALAAGYDPTDAPIQGRPMNRAAYLAWCDRMGIKNPRFVPDDTPALDCPPF